jgi:hypothetical protein
LAARRRDAQPIAWRRQSPFRRVPRSGSRAASAPMASAHGRDGVLAHFIN